MIALDTNIIARVILNDDPTQYAAASEALSQDALITPTVLLELLWVLRSLGGLQTADLQEIVRTLAARSNITIGTPGAPEACQEFLRLWAAGLDPEDAAHVAFVGDVDAFVTFDKDFSKRAKKAGSTMPVELAR